MKVVIQRVLSASVTINGQIHSQIGTGFLVLLGIGQDDTMTDAIALFKKLSQLRIFPDSQGRFDQSVIDIQGDILVVSQFTLYANCTKGRRPSFETAASPDLARALYNQIITEWTVQFPRLKTGEFGADMSVSLVNSGPVTIILDSRDR